MAQLIDATPLRAFDAAGATRSVMDLTDAPQTHHPSPPETTTAAAAASTALVWLASLDIDYDAVARTFVVVLLGCFALTFARRAFGGTRRRTSATSS
jgi:hypothetical protein